MISGVGVHDVLPAEVRLYERLFVEEHPEARTKDFNEHNVKVLNAFLKPSLGVSRPITAKADEKFQFERHGYFVANWEDHAVGKPVFNLAVGFKNSLGK